MKKVILFGGTGRIGKKIAEELKIQGYEVTAAVRQHQKADELKNLVDKCIIANVTNPTVLHIICEGFDIVISSLGKSVSLNDQSKPSFHDIDFVANAYILAEALKSGVKKFVYVSALHAEQYLHLEYFKAHRNFSEELRKSGINYAIIKLPAIFSAFLDMIPLAKKGLLMNIGKGDKLTNPIYEGDLAKICVEALKRPNVILEAGGKAIYSRKQLNEIMQHAVDPNKKICTMPLSLVKMVLPVMKWFDKNTFDKFSFFIEVVQHDTIAPQIGEMKFENYIAENLRKQVDAKSF